MDDKVLIRIDSIIKNIDEVSNDLRNVDYIAFCESTLLPRAISFSIALIAEQMIRLEEKIGDSYKEIPWTSARGMRNLIVHEYDSVDFVEVYHTATVDLPILKDQFLKIRNEIV